VKVSENLGAPRLHAVGCLELESRFGSEVELPGQAAGMGNGTQSGQCSN
jgi:hypothetical protein